MSRNSDVTVASTDEDRHRYALKLFQEGNYTEAAHVLDGVLKRVETGEFWNDWATAKLMCNQIVKSEYGYRRALSIDPANASAAGNLGVVLARTGRFSEALPLLKKAAAGRPGREHDALLREIRTCRMKVSSLNHVKTVQAPVNGSWRARSDDIGQLLIRHRPEREQDAALSNRRMASLQSNAAKAGVYFQGHIYGGSGYAEEAWVTALGVSDHNIPVQLVPIGHTRDTKRLLPDSPRRKLEMLQRQRVNLSQSIYLQFAGAGAWDMETSGRWCVVRTMFETDRLPDGVSERCNAMDEVWVPSRFNLETYARAGVKENRLRFVPPGVDTQLFCPEVNPLQVPRTRGFNFLSVFDWHQRKGYDTLLRAYLQEFKPDEDVALILKVSQFNDSLSDLATEIVCFVERVARLRLEDVPPIMLVNGFIPQHEMPRLYATAGCFVLPTRGEGYCRPFLEALSCQVPVIATAWSGQTDFLNRKNSYPIDCRLVPVPDDVDLEIYAGQRWAEPNMDHLRQLMRHVFSHQEEARGRAERGRADIVREYDWRVVIPQWMAEVRRLLD